MNLMPAGLLARLNACFRPEDLLTEPADCWSYGYDNSKRHVLPEAVVFPRHHDQVLELASLCNTFEVALTPRGRGTGTTGASVPVRGGIVVSMERMTAIREISVDNRYVVVEPGVTNQALQDYLQPLGFFWAPDPTSAAFCSIGGNLAYNSAGPRAVKYGTPRDNTLGLRAVTGAGETLRCGVYTTKGVVGYDLTRLLIGSEGTLAIITEAVLKLTPLAEARQLIRLGYRDVAAAARAVASIMAQPVLPCALEFIDGNAIRLVRESTTLDLPEGVHALLMVEVDGFRDSISAAMERLVSVASNEGLVECRIADNAQEAEALWAVRKALSPALRKIAPKKINEDVVVPVTAIPDLISGIDQLSQRFSIAIVNFGHAGNGNIHVNLLFDPDDADALRRAHACLDALFSLVISLRGSLSGEHGVGLEKLPYMDRELDATHRSLMRGIKQVFDPRGILNPDKLFVD